MPQSITLQEQNKLQVKLNILSWATQTSQTDFKKTNKQKNTLIQGKESSMGQQVQQ